MPVQPWFLMSLPGISSIGVILVTYVKNFTDVDDKIIMKANSEGKTISEISDRYIREHDEDMDALRIARPTVAPRATQHIDGMIT